MGEGDGSLEWRMRNAELRGKKVKVWNVEGEIPHSEIYIPHF